MRTWLTKTSVVAGLAGLVLLGGSVSARADIQELLTVRVPFPFLVEGKTLPAGQYVIQRDDTTPSVLMLQGEHGNRAFAVVETDPAPGHDPAGQKPVLTFVKKGAGYELHMIWEDRNEGEEVPGR